MSKLLTLTDNAWLIRAGESNSGLLFKLDDGTFSFLGPSSRSSFKSMDEVTKKFGRLKLIEREVIEDANQTINGYPVKHRGFVAIENVSTPQYKRTSGNTIFVAGYWGIKFPQGWTQAYCPKITTLDGYESVGPFKNRLEMLNHLASLNNYEHLKKLGDDNAEHSGLSEEDLGGESESE